MRLDISKWDERFLRMVDEVTSWSKDPTTKCGAIIVRPDRSIVSYGYNGFPSRIGDRPMRLNDRPLKNELVVHSEINALLFARENCEGYTMYTSTVPCYKCGCAIYIIQAKIARVICRPPSEDYINRWGIQKTMDLFKEGRVICYWE